MLLNRFPNPFYRKLAPETGLEPWRSCVIGPTIRCSFASLLPHKSNASTLPGTRTQTIIILLPAGNLRLDEMKEQLEDTQHPGSFLDLK